MIFIQKEVGIIKEIMVCYIHMSNKKKNRLNLMVDDETLEMSKTLREKHHVNISSVARKAIRDLYNKLEEK